jgi:hypothetical protein
MKPELEQAFLDASGIHASHLSQDIRIIAGLMMVIVSVFIIAGLLKLLEMGDPDHQIRFILYLIGLSITLMIYFTFVVG